MITLDQSKIDAPDFPRSQEWWTRFLPGWVTGTVNDDGSVTVEPVNETLPATRGRERAAAAQRNRNREDAIVRWLRNLPQLEAAIIEDAGEPCQCWRQPVRLHEWHCCFKTASICHRMPEDMRGPQGEIPPLVAS